MAAAGLALAACGSTAPTPPADPPGAPAAPPPVAAPTTPPTTPSPTCTRGRFEQIVASDDGGAIACMADGQTRDCWSIGADAAINPVHGVWPGIRTTTPGKLLASPGWTATETMDGDRIAAIELCGPNGCERVPLVHTGEVELDEQVAGIAVTADGTRVAIDRGTPSMGSSQVELHALAPAKRLRVLAMPDAGCIELLGWFGPALIAHGTDCANDGGTRAIFNRAGKRLATLRTENGDLFGSSDPIVVLRDDRVLFVDPYGLQVHDLKKGTRIDRAANPLAELGLASGAVVTSAGTIVLISNAGDVAMLDGTLAPLGTSAIPRCAKSSP
jgi:hypothetical protein